MNNNRRKFLQSSSLLATGFMFAKPLKTFAGVSNTSLLKEGLQLNTVQIVHTSDLHGRRQPFAFGGLHNIGGLNNIHSVIKAGSAAPLLVDAGDFLDGNTSLSDHVNMIRLMNSTNYTAVTIGDKELLQGEAHLASLVPYMNFTVVNCNYHFSNPVLKAKVQPYHVVRYGQYKIGITGVGPSLAGRGHADGVTYSQPYEKANEAALYLKHQLHCDLVICLSHLGFEQENGRPDNKTFAAASENIDLRA
jgi:5'-nucleotidase